MSVAPSVASCRKVEIAKDGYVGDEYHGDPQYPLFHITFHDGRSGYVRARNREEAVRAAIARPDYWEIR